MLRPDELAQACAELNEQLAGAAVQRAYVALPRLCYLELRLPGRTWTLCLSAEPGVGRMSVAQARLPSPREPYPLQRWLRAHLEGAQLAGASAHGREVTLRFARPEPRYLHLLLAVGGGNLVLCGPEHQVLYVAKARPELAPGAIYTPAEPGRERPLASGAATPPSAERPPSAPSRLAPSAGEALSVLRGAEALLAARERAGRTQELRRRRTGPLKARLARLLRTIAKVRSEAERGPQAEEHRRFGELLARNAAAVLRGQSQVRLVEHTADGPREQVVPLDPALAPKAQADRHFRQYRRLQRGCEHARRRLGELLREGEVLRARLEEEEARSEDELLAAAPREGPARDDEPRARPYRLYRAHGGAAIWVGRGGAANDELTFQVARPHHLWLHARGVSGAHVVVPLERGQELPQELLLDAAHLALHHSDLKGEPTGEVSYTEVKHVRRIKGGAPGQVSYSRERTFWLRCESARLARLLAGGEAAPPSS